MNAFRHIYAHRHAALAHAILLAVLAFLLFALPALAETTCTGNNCLRNPIRFPTIDQFIQGVLRAIVMIGLPVITVFIVYAGFKFILAQGSSDALRDAKRNFLWVLIGAALILGAWVLATLIGGTVTQLLG